MYKKFQSRNYLQQLQQQFGDKKRLKSEKSQKNVQNKNENEDEKHTNNNININKSLKKKLYINKNNKSIDIFNINVQKFQPDEEQKDYLKLIQKYKMIKDKIRKPSVLKHYFPQIDYNNQTQLHKQRISKNKVKERSKSITQQKYQYKTIDNSHYHSQIKFDQNDRQNQQKQSAYKNNDSQRKKQKYYIRMNFTGDQVQKIRNQIQDTVQLARKKRFLPFGASRARNLQLIRSKKQANLNYINFNTNSKKHNIQQIFSKKKPLNEYQISKQIADRGNVLNQVSKINSCTLQQAIYYG